MNYVNWAIENIDGIMAVLAGLHVTALAIVNVTNKPEAGTWINKVYGVIEKAAGLIHPKAKQ